MKNGTIVESAKGDDGFCWGRVLRTSLAKGFSFLDGSAWGYQEDMFLHGAIAPPAQLATGDVITCGLHLSSQGKPQAKAPVWKIVGHIAEGTNPRFGTYTGRLKNLQPGGSAFVECPEVREEFRRDAFVHASVVEAGGLDVGDTISFEVHVNGAGRPQVSEHPWKCLSDGSYVELGAAVVAAGGAAVAAAVPGAAEANEGEEEEAAEDGKAAKRPRLERPENLLFGTVKTAGRGKEFIFMDCPESGHDLDVFVHKAVIDPGSVEVGDTLAFTLHFTPDGKPQAAAPVWRLCGWLGEGEKIAFGEYVGTIEKLTAAGAGEVDCREATTKFGRRPTIYSTLMQSKGLDVGDVVAFDVRTGSKGHLQVAAPFWRRCPSDQGAHLAYPQAAPSLGRGKVYIGAVKSVDLAKGYGFIDGPAAGFKQDVFVLHSVADPSSLTPGQVVGFQVKFDEKDRPQAAAPLWRMAGWLKEGLEPQFGKYTGDIARLGSVGMGFVSSDAIQRQFGRDVFIHSRVMENCELSLGDHVAFDVHVSGDGQPQLSAPCWVRVPASEVAAPDAAHASKAGEAHGRDANAAGLKRPLLRPSSDVAPAPKRNNIPAAFLAPVATAESPSKGRATALVAGESVALSSLQLDEDIFLGAVLSTDLAAGLATVDCPDSGCKADVQVRKSVADPGELSVDDAVAFKLCTDRSGVPYASPPLWRLVGWPQDIELLQFGEYFGQIRYINPGGHGFLDSPDIKALHGHEAAIKAESLKEFGIEVGDVIAFTVQVDPDLGIPWVTAPCWRCCSSAWAAQRGLVMRGPGANQVPRLVPSLPVSTAAASSSSSSARPAPSTPPMRPRAKPPERPAAIGARAGLVPRARADAEAPRAPMLVPARRRIDGASALHTDRGGGDLPGSDRASPSSSSSLGQRAAPPRTRPGDTDVEGRAALPVPALRLATSKSAAASPARSSPFLVRRPSSLQNGEEKEDHWARRRGGGGALGQTS